MPNHPRPILFVAFANDLTNPARNLSGLEREFVSIEAAFATVAGEDRPYVLLPNRKCTAEGLVEPFYTNQVTVFHYAGHAGPEAFELETDAGGNAAASREGLQKFLTRQERLRLIFLNACSTRKWAEELAAAGGCCVVATSRAIPDAIAPKIAHAFYANLASGCTIQEAFDKGATGSGAQFETALRDFGDLHTAEPGADHATDGLPWALYGSEWVRQWRLCDGTDDPLLGLPALDEKKYPLPTSPYVDLEGHKEEHARIFFGRNGEIRQLYDWAMQPTAHPILLFYGQSGAGKSSLLRAGLLPRLGDCAKVVRRGTDLKEDLEHAIEARAGDVAGWMGAGATSLIVLDQVEEAITLGKREEMAHFVARLQEIFAERAPESKARLILSFRKEYLAEIANLLEQALPGVATELFLERLDKESIERVVLGPVRSQAAREKYRLRAGAAFARFVADTLDDGRGPVATVLQIVLRRMWEEARQRVGGNEAAEIEYSEELYREVIGKQPLQQFLDEQMKWLRENGWSAEVDGGLELDLLREHTTEFVTSRPRAREELNAAYAKKTRDLALLLEHNKKLHLLTEPADDGKPAGTTVLAHDTLARVVRQEWELSQSAGARARRILENRARSWEGTTGEEPDKTTKNRKGKKGNHGDLLDAADLSTVQRGRGQMRALTPAEESMFKASLARVRKLRAMAAVLGLVLLAAALLGLKIYQVEKLYALATDTSGDAFHKEIWYLYDAVLLQGSGPARPMLSPMLEAKLRNSLSLALIPPEVNRQSRWDQDDGSSQNPCDMAIDNEGRPLTFASQDAAYGKRSMGNLLDNSQGVMSACDGSSQALMILNAQSRTNPLTLWRDGKAELFAWPAFFLPIRTSNERYGVTSTYFSNAPDSFEKEPNDEEKREKEGVQWMALAPGARRVALGVRVDRPGRVMWEVEARDAAAGDVWSLMDAQDAGGEMHFSADGSLLGYADLESGVAHIWSLDPALGKKGPVQGHPDATAITAEPSITLRGVSMLAFGRRGRRQMVATGGGAGFQLFEITMTPHGPALTRLYELPHPGVTSLLFSADGKHLAEGNQDGHVRIFAVPKNLQFRAPVNETGGVDTTKLDMSEMRPDFQQVKYYRVAPATDDIWVEQEIDTEAGPVRFLAFSPDDGLLATASDHSEMRTWKLFRDYHKLAASGTVTGPWPLAPLDGMILAGCTDLDTYIEREAQETHVSRDRNQVLSDVDFGRLASGCRSFLRRRASIEKEPAR